MKIKLKNMEQIKFYCRMFKYKIVKIIWIDLLKGGISLLILNLKSMISSLSKIGGSLLNSAPFKRLRKY